MSVYLGSAYAELNLDLGKFRQGIKDAKSDLKIFGADIDSVASGLQSAGKSIEGAGKKLTKTVTAPIIGLGAAAVKTTADFDSSMSQVYATMGEKAQQMVEYNGKTVSSMEALRDFAQEMGAQTKFSASQAADALNYMALAGYDAETSMAMLPNVLNLAAAGNMDLARASDMVTDTQTAFGISLERTSQMVDEMAKAASTGNTSVEQLGDAFLVVGGLLQETNGGFVEMADGTKVAVDNVQEMEIALTAMANAGVKGSEAGTHMRNMLLKLASPTEDGYKAFQQLGVSVFDTEGNMRSLNNIFTDLNASFENLTQEEKLNAISAIFNTRDTAAAEALLKAVGQDWDAIGESILNAEGAAQTMADTQLQNLNGQLTILKSGIEGLLIQIGDMMMPYLMKITEKIQNLVTYLISLDEQQKQQIAKWLALAAAIGPVLVVIGKLTTGIGGLIGTVGKFVPNIVGLAKGFGLISAQASGMSAITGALGALATTIGPILAVVAAIAALAIGLKELYDQGGAFTESVNTFAATLRDDLGAAIEYIRDLFSPVTEAVKSGLEIIKGSIDAINFKGIVASIDGVVSNITNTVMNFYNNILKPLITAIVNFLRPLFDLMIARIRFLLDVIMGVINGIVNAISPFVATVSSFVNMILDIINMAIGLIKGIFTGNFDALEEATSKFCEDFKSYWKNLLDTIIAFVQGFAEVVWSDIKGFFQNIANSLSNWIKHTINSVTTFFSDLKNKFINFIHSVIMRFIAWLNNLIREFLNFFITMKNTAIAKAKEVWESLKTTVKEFPNKFFTWLQKFPQKVKDTIDAMKQAGKDLMNSLWDGLKETWDEIISWFEGVVETVKNFVNNILDNMRQADDARSQASGSHAGGLAYVPYDGYIAQLHEGERVLTRNEAEDYNSGHTGARGDTFIFNSPKALDPYESNKLFRQTIKEREEGFYD